MVGLGTALESGDPATQIGARSVKRVSLIKKIVTTGKKKKKQMVLNAILIPVPFPITGHTYTRCRAPI